MTRGRGSRRPDRIRIWRASVTKWQAKAALTFLGLAIMAAVVFATRSIVDELAANETRTVTLYAKLLDRSYKQASDDDLLFYVDLTYNSIHFPVIITDKAGLPVYPYKQFMINVDMDTAMSVEEQKAWLVTYIGQMERDYPPLVMKDDQGRVVSRMYYTNSALVQKLKYMPFVEILAVTAFILVGYVAFSTIRRNEESNIWVGMAKEAAHQLGTPLSSMLAWLDILRMDRSNPERVEQTAREMEQDVLRLNVIANRFAKIGSQPKLEPVVIATVIDRVCAYFETRLPNLGRRVTIARELDHAMRANISVELFEWVIENLIKNAVEAIERNDGRITISMRPRPKGGVIVQVADNGKGMTRQVAARIFQPGYTTKKRGWGLGLSLSRRIIEDYHGGRIYVKESHVGSGTTFWIELPNV